MQLRRRKIEGKQIQVLHDERIYAGLIEPAHQIAGRPAFFRPKQGIDGRMDLDSVQPGMAAQPRDLLDRIAGRRTCAEGGACNINGIGTTVDCCDADFRISRRREKFES